MRRRSYAKGFGVSCKRKIFKVILKTERIGLSVVRWYGRCIACLYGGEKSWLWDGLSSRIQHSSPIKSPVYRTRETLSLSRPTRETLQVMVNSHCFSEFWAQRSLSLVFKSWSNLGFRERLQLRPVGNDLSQTLSPRGRLRHDKLLKIWNIS